MALSASARPISGAVATIGVSDRIAFLRKTYATLGVALLAFAALTGLMMNFATETSLRFSMWALTGGGFNWLIVIGLFMLVGWIAQKLAYSGRSSGVQYLGLGIAVAAEALLLQPLLWVVMFKYGNPASLLASDGAHAILSAQAGAIIMQAVVITLSIFVGLTLVVFLTKKDFSFMRGVLTICSFAVLGVIIASIIFGFSLGALFCGFVVLLMAGYILYQTSLVMAHFPPTASVAAALMLFSTIATLFWYVLQLLMSLNNRR